jgi:large subunit ribosomal protein L19e
MNLLKKKELAARTLNVGKSRIVFNKQRIEDIKEAITKQDIRDLQQDKAILVKQIKGKSKIKKRKTRRGVGTRKKKVNTRKQDYVILTRKLRSYLATLKKQNKIEQLPFIELRKEIRARTIKSLAHMKERIKEAQK